MMIAAVMWLVVIGTLAVVVLPGLVGGFVDHLGFSEQAAGIVAAAQLFGTAFGLLIPTFCMTRLNLRLTILFALVLVLACDLLSAAAARDAGVLSLVRFAAGAGAGVVLGVAIGIISAMRNPDAMFGWGLVAQFTVGGAGLYLLPGLLGSVGMQGVFLCFAGICAVGFAGAPWIPRGTAARGAAEEAAGSLSTLLTGGVILVLLAFSLFYVSNGAQWTYLDRIGAEGGLPAEKVGVALSISMLFGILGAVAAAMVAGRVSRDSCLLFGTTLAVVSPIMLTLDFEMVGYTIAACLVNFALSFVVPFYLGILADFDPTGRVGSIAYVLNFLSMSIGPAAGAMMIGSGYDPLLFVTAGVYAMSFVLVLFATRQLAPSYERS